MIDPLRIYEGPFVNPQGAEMQFTCAIYPPLFYRNFGSWACAMRLSFAPDIVHFAYGASAEHAIERATIEALGFSQLFGVRLIDEQGLDFETYTGLGRNLPSVERPGENFFDPDYDLPPSPPKLHPTPEETPVHLWRGWRTIEGEMQEIFAAIYAPVCLDEMVWAVTLRCPAIFESNKNVQGIGPDQALELAEWLLKDLWNFCGFEPRLEQIQLN